MRYFCSSAIVTAISFIASLSATAQIGYQVSLLNNATGEPRANETVTVNIEITNSEGGTVCAETKSETTNDFGVLSMTVGSDAIFANTDWSKLPFFISATVDGVLIGRSQLLSVPIAECAKTLPSCKDKIMAKTWTNYDTTDNKCTLTFHANTLTIVEYNMEGSNSYTISYAVQGNIIVTQWDTYIYDSERNVIIGRGKYK